MLKSTLYQIFAIPTNGEKTNRFFEQPTRQGFPLCSRWRCGIPHNPVRGCISVTTMFPQPVENESLPGI